MLKQTFRWISYALAALALGASVALLTGDAKLWHPPLQAAAAISAAPLLLAGASFLFLQPILRLRFLDLLKNVMLAATFLLWGAIQLMPPNAMAQRLGNLVIALYVLDLAWVTFAVASPAKESSGASS